MRWAARPSQSRPMSPVKRTSSAWHAEAIARFGKIDVWFNDAGARVFGRFKDIPNDVWRRVIETNVFGNMYGAKAAMRQFRAQGHGVLINNASIVGCLAKPDSTAYATSKFAIRGLAEALRQEVLDQPNIHICTILPSVIDTPFFQHAANFSHHRVRAAPPVYTPEKVAAAPVLRPDLNWRASQGRRCPMAPTDSQPEAGAHWAGATVVVTGASSGIVLAIARAFARQRANLVSTARGSAGRP